MSRSALRLLNSFHISHFKLHERGGCASLGFVDATRVGDPLFRLWFSTLSLCSSHEKCKWCGFKINSDYLRHGNGTSVSPSLARRTGRATLPWSPTARHAIRSRQSYRSYPSPTSSSNS